MITLKAWTDSPNKLAPYNAGLHPKWTKGDGWLVVVGAGTVYVYNTPDAHGNLLHCFFMEFNSDAEAELYTATKLDINNLNDFEQLD